MGRPRTKNVAPAPAEPSTPYQPRPSLTEGTGSGNRASTSGGTTTTGSGSGGRRRTTRRQSRDKDAAAAVALVQQHYPRRNPRIGGAFQVKSIPDVVDDGRHRTSRPAPCKLSVEFPHRTERELLEHAEEEEVIDGSDRQQQNEEAVAVDAIGKCCAV